MGVEDLKIDGNIYKNNYGKWRAEVTWKYNGRNYHYTNMKEHMFKFLAIRTIRSWAKNIRQNPETTDPRKQEVRL